MIVKLLTEHHLECLSFKGGCRGSSESTLAKMSNCWKSRALTQMYIQIYFEYFKSVYFVGVWFKQIKVAWRHVFLLLDDIVSDKQAKYLFESGTIRAIAISYNVRNTAVW